MKIYGKLLVIALAILGTLGSFQASAEEAYTTTDYYHFSPDFSGIPPTRVEGESLLVANYGMVDMGPPHGIQDFTGMSFLKFDLSGISGTAVSSAVLMLERLDEGNHVQPSNGNPMDVHIHDMSVDVENTMYSKADLFAGVTSHQSTTTIGDAGVYSWDITALVNGWLSGSIANNGIALVATPVNSADGGLVTYFASGTNNSAVMPNIQITAVPEPSTWLLMIGGLGLVGLMGYRRRH